MNKPCPTPIIARPAAPPFAIYATVNPIQPEPAPLWISALTSQGQWSGRKSDLTRHLTCLGDDRTKPIFATTNLLLGTRDPARNPLYRVRREGPYTP